MMKFFKKSSDTLKVPHYANKIACKFTQFKAAESGNIALMFGLMLVPFVGAVGLSVDYGLAVSARTRLQANIDSAALAAGREFQVTGSTSAATAKAASTFNALMANDSHAALVGNEIDPVTNTIKLTAETLIKSSFAGVLGLKKMDVGATSSATLAQGALDKNLEVAISLDVTGSMYGSKIGDLKVAAKDLIDIILHDSTSSFTSRVALIPFSSTVRPTAELLAEVREDAHNGTATGNSNTALMPTITFQNRWGNDWTWSLSDCVGERHGPHAYTDKMPNGQHYVSPVYTSNGSCKPLAEVMPLTEDKTMLKNHVDTFQATGYTSGHLGTAWAYYMLSPLWKNILPAASEPSNFNIQEATKVAILMTDGQYNTQYTEQGIDDYYVSANSPNGTSSTQAVKLCDSMKDDDIVVYTVGFAIYSSSVQQMLKDCATSESHYFLAGNGDELQEAFREIAFKLVQLRLSE